MTDNPHIDRTLDDWVALRIDPVTIQRLRLVARNRSAYIRDAIQVALGVSEQTTGAAV
jgi:hypothetical protein